MTADELAVQNTRLALGDPITAADAAEKLAQLGDKPSPEWIITVYNKFWEPLGEVGDFIECTGADPRNNLPTATVKLKGADPLGPSLMECRTTMVGVTIETGGIRMAFYVDTCEYVFEGGEWTYTANLVGIWDCLNYLQVWPN